MKDRPLGIHCMMAGNAAQLNQERDLVTASSRFVIEVRSLTFKSNAFSLLELLVVVAIMVILLTMYWGSGSGTRQKKLQADCLNNLQKSYIAMEIFAREHNGKFPETVGAQTSEEPLDALVPRYTSDTSLFTCPASKDPALPSGESIRKSKISYAYYMGRHVTDAQEALLSDKQVDTLPKATGQLVFSSTGKPPGNNHEKNGGNFLFCDGHVQSAPVFAPFPLMLNQGVVLLNPKP
jgi:prepilin-type N-terminal cleavage/methylation domain-containing protein/prepilin-type processing-associated H-X9-DG protein